MGLKATGQRALSHLLNTVTVASGAAVSLTTATPANITSISLGIGTYLIWGTGDYTLASATATEFRLGLSATTNTLPTQAGGSGIGTDPLNVSIANTSVLSDTQTLIAGPTTFTIAATTTLYLVAQATFSAGTVSAYGTLFALQINLP